MLKLIDLVCRGTLHASYPACTVASACASEPLAEHAKAQSQTNFGLLHDHRAPCLATVVIIHADS